MAAAKTIEEPVTLEKAVKEYLADAKARDWPNQRSAS
jgi:hypothetical protein